MNDTNTYACIVTYTHTQTKFINLFVRGLLHEIKWTGSMSEAKKNWMRRVHFCFHNNFKWNEMNDIKLNTMYLLNDSRIYCADSYLLLFLKCLVMLHTHIYNLHIHSITRLLIRSFARSLVHPIADTLAVTVIHIYMYSVCIQYMCVYVDAIYGIWDWFQCAYFYNVHTCEVTSLRWTHSVSKVRSKVRRCNIWHTALLYYSILNVMH